MAENLVRYGAGLEFTGMAAIQKMRKALSDLNRIQQESYRRQTASLKAKDTALARMLQQEQKNYEIVQATITKRHAQEEKERTRRSISAVRDRLRAEQQANNIGKARIKQAVGNITAPTGAENMRAYYQELERSERKRLGQLERYKASLSKEYLLNKDNLSLAEQAYKNAIKQAMMQAKTADELRNAVKAERVRLRIARENTREYEKQNFLMRRMQQSSQQIAGNMVSAFAAAGLVSGITRVGQEFESVSNTMLSVTNDARLAGQHLAFVRDEAMRLGTPLKEGSKQFAKMLASAGDTVAIGTIQESFRGLSEMSTVLGLSADESGRAFTALTQVLSKNQVMA
ncbi:TPA: hypothetical protein ACOAY7_002782 [Vibrio cholerae]